MTTPLRLPHRNILTFGTQQGVWAAALSLGAVLLLGVPGGSASSGCTPKDYGTQQLATGSSLAGTSHEAPTLSLAPDGEGPVVEIARDAPVSLTTTDGAGLQLIDYDARVVVEGPLAFTELHLTFDNPEQRIREGRFQIRLPQDAAISRFAMRTPAGFQEAEVVERQQAQLIYEDFLHRRVDPALLENSAGNEFSARVFPIAPGERKELIVSFTSELPTPGKYVLPLVGLPQVARLVASVSVLEPGKAPQIRRFRADDEKPLRDLEVDLPSSEVALGKEGFVVTRVTPKLESTPASLRDLTVLVDTSASRMLNLRSDVEALAKLLSALAARLPGNTPLELIAFDQEVEPLFQGTLGTLDSKPLKALLERRALGATDLGSAFATLRGKQRDRVLLYTDAIATAGEVDALLKQIEQLDLKLERVDVLSSGGLSDGAMAQALARDVAPHAGITADSGEPVQILVNRLLRTTHSLVPGVAGALWIYPSKLEGVQPGDSRVIYAAFDPRRPLPETLPITLQQGRETHRLTRPLLASTGPLVRRAAAAAEVRRLEALLQAQTGDANAHRSRILELSTRFRILCDSTALLVLETAADYERYGLERKALADILRVSDSGKLELFQRTSPLGLAKDGSPEMPSATRRVDLDADDERENDAWDRGEVAAESPREEPTANESSSGRAGAGAPHRQTSREPSPSPKRKSAAAPPAGRVSGGATAGAPPAPPRPHRSPAPTSGAPPTFAEGRSRAEAPSTARPTSRSHADSVQHSERAASPGDPFAASSADWLGQGPDAHTGRYAQIQALLSAGRFHEAVSQSMAWLAQEPGDALALLALGESLEASGDLRRAARAYGSWIDLYPSRTDLRRFAATRLDLLSKRGHWLAVDSSSKARSQRPDHLTGYRLEAYALLHQGRYERAVDAIRSAFGSDSRINRAAHASEVLRHDLSLIGAVWARAEPKRAEAIQRRLSPYATIATRPSLSFVLSWETDANDVDLHVLDARGGHAYYRERTLASGGTLLEDVTNGYGPELFVVEGKPSAFPYELGVHYYSRGPMGYGMGRVQILRHDGKGRLDIETRPFVIMNDGAKVSLGTVTE